MRVLLKWWWINEIIQQDVCDRKSPVEEVLQFRSSLRNTHRLQSHGQWNRCAFPSPMALEVKQKQKCPVVGGESLWLPAFEKRRMQGRMQDVGVYPLGNMSLSCFLFKYWREQTGRRFIFHKERELKFDHGKCLPPPSPKPSLSSTQQRYNAKLADGKGTAQVELLSETSWLWEGSGHMATRLALLLPWKSLEQGCTKHCPNQAVYVLRVLETCIWSRCNLNYFENYLNWILARVWLPPNKGMKRHSGVYCG